MLKTAHYGKRALDWELERNSQVFSPCHVLFKTANSEHPLGDMYYARDEDIWPLLSKSL